jgi:hypothetical protein
MLHRCTQALSVAGQALAQVRKLPQAVLGAQFRDWAEQSPNVVPERLRQSVQLTAGGVTARTC